MNVVLGLGANLGSRRATLDIALEVLSTWLRHRGTSAIYETPALTLAGRAPGPAFLNAAARFDTDLSLEALHARTTELEARLGRVRRERWGDRTLDIDILWASEGHHSAHLQVPHPRLEERAFALHPLLDVAPELRARYAVALAALPAPRRAEGEGPLDREARAWSKRFGGAKGSDAPVPFEAADDDALARLLRAQRFRMLTFFDAGPPWRGACR